MAELANKSDHKCKRWLVNPIRIIQRHCIIQILQIAGEWFGAKSWGFVFLCLGTSSTGGGGRGGEGGCTHMRHMSTNLYRKAVFRTEFTESRSWYIVLIRNRLLQNSDPIGTGIRIQTKIFYDKKKIKTKKFYDKEKIQTKKKLLNKNRH